ncbi:hypothetical protein BCR35DRAFT_309703 [Leucosporidium creatinivorum]|uniref:F-box domain-containing protein n=1 Tax=Leucosporidium creatinivorum TaxID=106004 RepID=A0A1Y2DCV9_9BASI|nr:hypothetical protein BCR35DRAFT_309703 [Leucosporidium creatinivorum]
MDIQPDQQPASTAYARPRQPADSPAAALPTETLQHILELALEDDEDPFERQSTRRSFSKVCYHWYTVVPSPIEYAVSSARSARKLALRLRQSTSDPGEKVRSLVIRLDAVNGVNRGGRTAKLLEACRNVEHLSIDLKSALTGGYMCDGGGMGYRLYEAAKKLKGLRVLELLEEAYVSPAALADIVEVWPELHALRLNCKFHPSCRPPPLPVAEALRHLDISGDVELAHALLPYIAPLRTTFSLIVRGDPLPDSRFSGLLLPFADRLDKFAAPDGWLWSSTLRSMFLNMKNVHTLELHHSIIKDAHLVLELHPLAELRELIIVGVATSAEDCAGLHVEWLLSHLFPSFERLRLPRQLAQLWTAAETKTVEDRAEQSQFELVWT